MSLFLVVISELSMTDFRSQVLHRVPMLAQSSLRLAIGLGETDIIYRIISIFSRKFRKLLQISFHFKTSKEMSDLTSTSSKVHFHIGTESLVTLILSLPNFSSTFLSSLSYDFTSCSVPPPEGPRFSPGEHGVADGDVS